MAMPAGHTIQDQNISIHFDGASLLGKNDISKAPKKGRGLGGRKALNDISNSAKPSALQASKKNYSTNVIFIGKDLDATRNKLSAGTKDKAGRKALTDLTNSTKPSAQQASKKGLGKKLSTAAANVPTSIAEEQFLHDHQKCIKAQRKAMDMGYFLKEIELDNEIPVQLVASPPRASKLSTKSMQETPKKKHSEVEEIPELLLYDQFPLYGKSATCGDSSPSVGSPTSPKLPYMSWKDVSAPYFTLIGTPNLPKH